MLAVEICVSVRRLCSSLIVTIRAGVSGPAVCAGAGESHRVFHTGGSVHTRGRQTRMFHWGEENDGGGGKDGGVAEEQPKEETTMKEEVLTANTVAQGGALFFYTHTLLQPKRMRVAERFGFTLLK